MSASKTATDNLTAAIEALTAEVGAEVAREDLAVYFTKLDEVIAVVREIRAPHAKVSRVFASQKSRAKKNARVAKALELLAATEAADGEEEVVAS